MFNLTDAEVTQLNSQMLRSDLENRARSIEGRVILLEAQVNRLLAELALVKQRTEVK